MWYSHNFGVCRWYEQVSEAAGVRNEDRTGVEGFHGGPGNRLKELEPGRSGPGHMPEVSGSRVRTQTLEPLQRVSAFPSTERNLKPSVCIQRLKVWVPQQGSSSAPPHLPLPAGVSGPEPWSQQPASLPCKGGSGSALPQAGHGCPGLSRCLPC